MNTKLLIEHMKRLMEIEDINSDVSGYLDSTYLKTAEQAGITDEDTYNNIMSLLEDALKHNMKLVMVRPEQVELARKVIDERNGKTLVGTVIDFPFGNGSTSDKVNEAKRSIGLGVDEIDYVADYNAFKRGNLEKFTRDIIDGTKIGMDNNKIVKWIIESEALTSQEIQDITQLIRDVVINSFGEFPASSVFVKTSTGFFDGDKPEPEKSKEEDVILMAQNSGPLRVKASGGIYTIDDLNKMVKAGATRIGTSAAKEIISGDDEVVKDY